MNAITTLLVVDDDADLREVVANAIQRDGLRVVEAADGREALDRILACGLPTLILLDMNMPVMDGWQLAAELKARSLTGAPIVVITAAHDAEKSATEIGAAAFIGKPFDLKSLRSTVERVLLTSSGRVAQGDPSGVRADR
jgi:CheY-like chemotaxis protein